MIKLNSKYIKRRMIEKYKTYLLPNNKTPMTSIKNMAACDLGISIRTLDRLVNGGRYSKELLERCIYILELDTKELFIRD
ncbi:hypothetical protein [Clostridium celatum]|uniref:hypothetical protein n=1 Tax=Clostridium celatum TaxID=36834 RepID=UPI0029052B61|nr:hypothetical protein [Clostridium celatum]MDU2265448.1 hypothetical protein [Clostridium celatum]MDU6295178.1 hypothetical protein [Clostridium celatum]